MLARRRGETCRFTVEARQITAAPRPVAVGQRTARRRTLKPTYCGPAAPKTPPCADALRAIRAQYDRGGGRSCRQTAPRPEAIRGYAGVRHPANCRLPGACLTGARRGTTRHIGRNAVFSLSRPDAPTGSGATVMGGGREPARRAGPTRCPEITRYPARFVWRERGATGQDAVRMLARQASGGVPTAN